MSEEGYKPKPEELIEAHSMMTPEQKELSAIREIFIESEHRIVELPLDLEYELDVEAWATRRLYSKISGTFDGRKIELQRSSWDKGKTWRYTLKTVDESKEGEEIQLLWDKIYPAVKTFEKMQNAETKAVRQLQQEKKQQDDVVKDKVALASKSAREQALDEGEQIGKIKGILEKQLEGIEASEEDREFLKGVIEKIAHMSGNNVILVLQLPKMVNFDPEEKDEKRKQYDQFRPKEKLLLTLLGAKESQKWVAGFGIEYIHSNVYDTILPGIILRECYDRNELSFGMDAEITIERNSRYQKKK